MNCKEADRKGKSGTSIRNWSGKKVRAAFIITTAFIVLVSTFGCAKANNNPSIPSTNSATSKQSSSSSSQNNSAGSNVNSTQPATTPTPQASTTVTTPTPPPPPAPVQQPTPPSQPAATLNVPPASQSSTGDMIKKEACTMILIKDDLGEGWIPVSVGPPSILYTSSVCHVYFTQGGSFAPVVQNTVAVFRTVQAASDDYDREKPANATVSNPPIGDECFLNDSAPINRELAFRKSNVVVFFWLQQYQTGDIEHYAQLVAQRVTP